MLTVMPDPSEYMPSGRAISSLALISQQPSEIPLPVILNAPFMRAS